MNLLVPITLFGWIPVVLALFAWFPAKRAVIVAFLVAWLFLPMAGFKIAEGIPAYTKMTATCLGVLLGIAIFDLGRLFTFRPHWLDLPIVAWCLCAIPSSLSNGYGLYDGLSTANYQLIDWGIPYFIGRLYFSDPEALQELSMGLFLGGLVYVPLCLYEIKMSPQLHQMVYGFVQYSFSQAKRFGGWRPMVFMQHGLMVGMWMCMTDLIGFWLWLTKAIRSWRGISMGWMVVVLLLTAILCKSFGAILLLAIGLGVLFFIHHKYFVRILVIALLISAPVYMVLRAGVEWHPDGILNFVESTVGSDRADSYSVRLRSEDNFIQAARRKPIFGWRHWTDSAGEWSEGTAIPDGLWMLALIQYGYIGLVSLALTLLLPGTMFFWWTPVKDWTRSEFAGAVALAVVVTLYMVDNLSNAMVNPIFMLAAGGLSGFAAKRSARNAPPLAMRRVTHGISARQQLASGGVK